jgi:hypothetical protein
MTIKTIVKTMKDYSPDNEDHSKDYETIVLTMKTTVKTIKDYSHDYEDYSKDY